MTKVLILTGDGAETLEVLYPYERLREDGYQPVVASLSAKKLQFVCHDFVEGFDTYTEKPAHCWPAEIAVADVDPADYVGLVLPGGRAPEYLRNNADVQRIVQAFFARKAPVAATCHGSMILATAGVLGGFQCSGYGEIAPEVRAGGAEYVDGEAVVDGHLVTARAWPDNGPWMGAFMKLLRAAAPAA